MNNVDSFRNIKFGGTFYARLRDYESGEVLQVVTTSGESLSVVPAKNIVLDGAYCAFAGGSIPVDALWINVGSGTSIPSGSQSGLDYTPAGTNPGTFTRDLINDLKWTISAYFGPLEANGNLTEVGASWSSDSIYLNRALFREPGGSPVIITKTESQVLDVTLEFQISRS
jgi:hypothetical protein